jgi:outer membrane receptor for ferrienterochelin and colicins
MKKFLLLLLSFVCLSYYASAILSADEINKTDANIVGHVLDKTTKDHLPFISVSLKGTTIGVMTDDTGHYFLKNLPVGTFILQVSAVGYKPLNREVTIKQGVTLEENFAIEEDLVALDQVVVTANRGETIRRLAPTLVNVLDDKLFQITSSSTLSQGLSFQPGVRVETDCQNCGYTQVRINGLEGPYTQILIDSRPIFSALAGVYGLEQLPTNMIERVEVMRGGGSALFGSSAIAGTINIITKEPVRNSAELAHTITGIDDLGTFDNATTLNASMVSDDQKSGLYIFGQNRERGGYDADGDGFTEMPKLRNQTIGFRSYLKTGTYSKFTFEYHHMHEFRRGGDNIDRPPHEAEIAEQIQHSINTGSVKFDYSSPDQKSHLSAYGSAENINRDSYYGGNKDLNAYGATKDLTWVAGSQYVYNFVRCIFMPDDFTAGLEYNQDNMDDNMWGYNRRTKQNVRIASTFFQNEWKNEKLSILLGGRLDKHNMINHVIFSPRANLRFNPTKDINLRASYSFGFRAPQAFDEDLHICNVGGVPSVINLAKNLKEEKSQSLSISADIYHHWGTFQGNFLLEGFYTSLSDAFALRETGKVDGILYNERYNEKGANVYGLSIEGKIAYRKLFRLQAGMTLQKAEYKNARTWSNDPSVPLEKKMFRTPDIYGYYTFSYNGLKNFIFDLTGTYTGRMLVSHKAGYIANDEVVKTPRFFEFNMKASYDFHFYESMIFQINGGIRNLFNSYQNDFDKGKNRDSGYVYGPGMPRSYFLGVKVGF